MLEVNFMYDTTVTIQERTAYDTLGLFGDIGGLNDFVFMIITPLMAFLCGSSYSYSLFSRIFWVNESAAKMTNETEKHKIQR